MTKLNFIVSLLIITCLSSITLVKSNANKRSSSIKKKVGEALFLTPLIEKEDIREARKKAQVQHHEMKNVESYAGYLTVNKTYNSNTFFWYFPSQVIAYLLLLLTVYARTGTIKDIVTLS